jgi:adenosylcobinamide-phosphate synthase
VNLALPFLLAYLLDLLLGDPPTWPHPVKLLGRIIQYWESVLYQPRVWPGALFWLAVMGTTLILVFGVMLIMALLPPWLALVVLVYCLYAGLATGSLHRESLQVETALSAGDLTAARERLAMIVGRETGRLGPEEIRRAVVETVAENLADGVVAPMFFTLALGLPGLYFYKAANTMDSMVGYKNYWYAHFGKVAARADDVLNFIPARVTALLMILAAVLLKLDWRGAVRVLWRDRGKAASPNAGWPEAAMAGALGVRLGGPSTYFGRQVEKPFIGEPTQPLDQESYGRAIQLLYVTSGLMAALTLASLYFGRTGIWGLWSLVR